VFSEKCFLRKTSVVFLFPFIWSLQAKEDGDKIWGIVMSGCNQDGKTNTPITAPPGEQQKVLLQKIYSSYGISPSTIQYIETHGKIFFNTLDFSLLFYCEI
jgi:hypothetical protein